ncbi:MAG: ABC transporter permease [Treponema sp.]|uniref:ABC transporter permease n=1 Tax=Treponema sp. TaxID=166 RepID=UPI00298DF0A0|nr:FtsX-like permease family protein [Treponema sp.]MBR5932976.1 ABC transporter permease [Treponema sp.]
MGFKTSALIASRMLLPRVSKKTAGTRSIIGAIVCIALSLIPLVTVLSVTDGMIEGIMERLINLSSSHIQAQFTYYSDEMIEKPVLDLYKKEFSETEGIKDAYELITATALVSSSKGRSGSVIRAIEKDVFVNLDSYKNLFKCVDGSIEDFVQSDSKCALIGKETAQRLSLSPGDTIRLITTQTVNGKIFPKMTPFKVSGIISSGYQELDSLWVFIPIEEGMKILKPENSTISIMMETYNPFDNLRNIQRRIDDILLYSGITSTWIELNSTQYENFVSTKMLLLFIMLLIVLVASVNISSCLVMLSMERRNEVAILKSVGTKKSDISKAFILTGLGIGSAGILIGIPLGILISVNINPLIHFVEKIVNFFAEIFYLIKNGNLQSFYTVHLMDEAYYLDKIPVEIPGKQIIIYIIATLVLSLLASLMPALKASGEKPIETFRKAGM